LNDTALLSTINEFQSPDFHQLIGIYIEIVLFLSIGAIIQAYQKRNWIDIGLLLLFAHLMLKSVRHAALAMIIMLPIIAVHWSTLLGHYRDMLNRKNSLSDRPKNTVINLRYSSMLQILNSNLRIFSFINSKLKGTFIYTATAIVLILLILSPWSSRIFNSNFDPSNHPIDAAEFIASKTIRGNIYSPDEYGDYLVYRLFPDIKVFIDGRSDFYRTGPVFNEYLKLISLDSTWSQILDKYNINYILINRNDPLGIVVSLSGDWNILYSDGFSQIFERVTISE